MPLSTIFPINRDLFQPNLYFPSLTTLYKPYLSFGPLNKRDCWINSMHTNGVWLSISGTWDYAIWKYLHNSEMFVKRRNEGKQVCSIVMPENMIKPCFSGKSRGENWFYKIGNFLSLNSYWKKIKTNICQFSSPNNLPYFPSQYSTGSQWKLRFKECT